MKDGPLFDEVDPYEKFMPVPAVPNSATDLQASRRPKDSLASVDLGSNPLNNVEKKPLETKIQKPPTTDPPVSTAPPRPVTAVSEQSFEDEKKEIRKKFKRCHSRCVQKKCLPVGNLNVYYNCVDKCKQLCTL